MRICVDMIGKWNSKDPRHVTEIIEQLGIQYEEAVPQPANARDITSNYNDQWVFHGVDPKSVPKDLPDFIDVLETDVLELDG